MTTPDTDIFESLLADIRGRFTAGISVGEDVLLYIDSTLSNPTAGEIATILRDERHPERDSLLELIFYPDLSFQIALEDRLNGRACSVEDRRRLRSALGGAPLATVIHFADKRESLSMTVPGQLIEVFLQRLNLSRAVPGRIIETVAQNLSAPDRSLTLVKFRNARSQTEDAVSGFLCSYIEQVYPDPIYPDGLDFLLSFLDQAGAGTDIYAALMSRKMRCCQTLKEIERFEEKRRSDNIETLMLRGERFPHADRQVVIDTITIIDRIATAIYGKTDWVPPAGGITENHITLSEKDLKDLIRLLSASH